jgi:hypothetical protein
VSANALNIFEWFETFRTSVSAQLDRIHPSAQCICHGYIGEMRMAIEAGDMTEFTRLLRMTQNKIADELEWEEDKRRSAADPRYVPRCCRG